MVWIRVSRVPAPPTVSRAARPVRLAGAHEWGEYSDAVARFGVQRRDVVVFAPGTRVSDRRWLRLWRVWPVAAPSVGVVTSIALSTVVRPSWAAALGIVLVVVLTAALAWRVRAPRTAMCAVGGVRMPDRTAADPDASGYETALAVAIALCAAETARRRGDISRVEYEDRWHAAYVRAQAVAGRTARHGL